MEQATRQKPFLNLIRSYPVAPEKVWRAWTDAQALKQCWGPGPGEPVAVAELDVRVGGRFRIVFGGKEGRDHEVQGVYVVVQPCRNNTGGKLAFTWTWPNTTPERESVVTIVFKASGVGAKEGTELEFKHEELFDESVRDGHKRGWTESFAKLDEFLAG